MMRNRIIIALSALLLASPVGAQEYIKSNTRSQLQNQGFSDSFLSKVKRNSSGKVFNQTFSTKGVWAQEPSESLPPPPDSFDTPGGKEVPSAAGSGPAASPPPAPTSESGKEGLPPMPSASGDNTGAQVKAPSDAKGDSNAAPKAAKKKTVKKKSKKRKSSSAPVVQSMPYQAPMMVMPQNSLPSPQVYSASGMPYAQGPSQEIYSQEPVGLPPVNQLPGVSRTTLPPLSPQAQMDIPLGEAVSRVLACNFAGLTGLNQTLSADVSKEGSFKMGFHTNWYTLERVYDRVLATGESGNFFESPLFFNYAPTNDLEFALMLPIIDYTVKSRILWPKDFRESGIGDTKLSFKYRVFDNNPNQMRGAFGLGFKFPTGNDAKGLGTGKTDFEVFTAFSKNFEKVIAHLNLGYIMTGDPNNQYYPDGLADIFYYNIGIEYPHTHNVTVMAELNGQDWGSEGQKIDVTPSVRYTPTENFAFDVAVPVNVTNDQRFGYNYRVTFGVCSFFK